MPVEVISLLSSPDVAPSRPAEYSKQPSLQPAEPPRRMLGYDVFDLTDSPRYSPPKKSGLMSFQGGASPTSRPKRPISEFIVNQDDFLFLSDDFDTTGDIDGNLVASLDVRNTKKPRLSGQLAEGIENGRRPFKRSASTSNHAATGPSVLQPAKLNRWNTVPDPIEFTSSPHAAAPSSQVRHNVDYDPFASSPMNTGPWMPEIKATVNSLPFSSNMNKENVPNAAHLGPQDLSSDPFATSPPRPRLNNSAKEPQAWDHISSSAPEASFRSDPVASPSRGLTRSRSEIIDLGDSDGAAASSDDEFPDLDNVDLARLKTRCKTYKQPVARPAKSSKSSKPAIKKPAGESARERADKAAAREIERVMKQKEKELAKEQRAQEKERAAALADVNKIRTDKKISTPEMIVDLSASLSDTTTSTLR